MGLAIGVDIGGTKLAAGVVDPQGRILARLRRDTPAQDPAKTQELIGDCIAELASDHEVEAAGLGAAGFIDAARSTVLFAPNLAWRNEPLRAAVEQRTGLPVVVENDANAAFEAVGTWLGHGMADLAAVLDPRVFIIGGGCPRLVSCWPARPGRPSRPS